MQRRGREDGFAVLVIFALLTIMVIFVVSNTRVLSHLHQELKQVEKRQMQKFEPATAATSAPTNAPAVWAGQNPH